MNASIVGQSVTNAATLSGSGLISAPLINAAGGVITANNGLLTIAGALTQNGTINVAAASTLDVLQAFANGGSLNLQGGFLVGGTVTNTSGDSIAGFGTISNAVVNAGLITASGGTLTLTAGAPVTQAGSGINVANAAALRFTPDWSNSGTLAVNGTLFSGTLTNTSNTGTLSGSGYINSFVVNQGRMNFGGTISNSFLQTAGSFTLSGNATITGNATISGGGVDLNGVDLKYNSLTISSSATLQNSGGSGAALNGNVVNAGTVNFHVNADANVNGNIVNSGTWKQAGVVSGEINNSGSFMWLTWTGSGNTPHLTGGINNSGSLFLASDYAAQVDGSITNSGTLTLHGTINGNYVQTAGKFNISAYNGPTATADIRGTASITGGTFDLTGQTYSNGLMVVSGTGVLSNAIAGATFSAV